MENLCLTIDQPRIRVSFSYSKMTVTSVATWQQPKEWKISSKGFRQRRRCCTKLTDLIVIGSGARRGREASHTRCISRGIRAFPKWSRGERATPRWRRILPWYLLVDRKRGGHDTKVSTLKKSYKELQYLTSKFKINLISVKRVGESD